MSEQIKVGDLVVIVRWPHACQNKIGKVFRVAVIDPLNVKCSACGEQIEPGIPSVCIDHPYAGCPITWVKRIPPLSELEGEKHKEELTA